MVQGIAVAAALSLLPSAAAAQDALLSAALQMGLPSASLDRRPLATSTSRDLFRATPTTFAPDFDEPPRFDPRFLCCGGFAGPAFVTSGPWWAPPQVVYVPVIVRETPPPAPPPPPAANPPPAPSPAPGPPKTFYVIPRCYAGDRRPEPDALPSGCDIARLRTIPPVAR